MSIVSAVGGLTDVAIAGTAAGVALNVTNRALSGVNTKRPTKKKATKRKTYRRKSYRRYRRRY